MGIVDTALAWLGMGVAVIPLQHGGKAPLVQWQPYQEGLPDEFAVRAWFNQQPSPNLGIVCGWNGLIVLDFDNRDWYEAWKSWAGELATTFTVKTGRGYHAYFFLGVEVRTMPLKFAGEHVIDVKGKGGYVVGAPSLHPSGHRYSLVAPARILHTDTLDDLFPQAWKELLLESEPAPQPTEPPAPRDPWDVINDASAPVGVSVDEVKSKIPLTRLLTGEMVQTSRGFYLTNCPLHDDQHPSMWVNLAEGVCGCYAGCTTKPLDVINLYARMKGISNGEALKELATWG